MKWSLFAILFCFGVAVQAQWLHSATGLLTKPKSMGNNNSRRPASLPSVARVPAAVDQPPAEERGPVELGINFGAFTTNSDSTNAVRNYLLNSAGFGLSAKVMYQSNLGVEGSIFWTLPSNLSDGGSQTSLRYETTRMGFIMAEEVSKSRPQFIGKILYWSENARVGSSATTRLNLKSDALGFSLGYKLPHFFLREIHFEAFPRVWQHEEISAVDVLSGSNQKSEAYRLICQTYLSDWRDSAIKLDVYFDLRKDSYSGLSSDNNILQTQAGISLGYFWSP